MSKILNNLPVEDLTKENDYLGVIDKGQIIKTFLESNTKEFKEIKMFSLYGEWGSGKSTLMKYLQKELKGSFNTFFFEAWEFESDLNLSVSLLEYLISESKGSTEVAFEEIVCVAEKLFKGFSKSIRISFPGLSVDGSKIVETLEEGSGETFLQLKSKFKTEFKRWEAFVAKGGSPSHNIVFIDDLDRCEPENVLNLLSALKLFFTYGENTIFFCGIDKKAVDEAVRTKYGKVVKANEYLEKVFDISFTMPEYNDLLKLVNQFFDKREVESIGGKLNENISEFLSDLKFTNPRRVKKLLNKFSILRSIKESVNYKYKYYRQIPNIYLGDRGDYFETILVLYYMILHEFHPSSYKDLLDVKKKESSYRSIMYKTIPTTSYSENTENSKLKGLFVDNYFEVPLNEIKLKSGQTMIEVFSLAFSPMKAERFLPHYFRLGYFKDFEVENKNIEYRFVEYLHNNGQLIGNPTGMSNISLAELKLIIKKVL